MLGGLKNLFNKDARKERSVQKNSDRAGNSKIKPEDRQPALYALLEDKSGPAVSGLLRRLTFTYTMNTVSDEQEKELVYDGLVAMGAQILPELKQHLVTSPTLAWGLKIAGEVLEKEALWELLQDVLKNFEPGYDRDPSRKLQLVAFIGELNEPRALEVLIPYLEDHDEAVRYAAVEGLFALKDARAQSPLTALLANEDEESLRIKNRIIAGFADNTWSVLEHKDAVSSLISGDFMIDGKGVVRRTREVAK